MPVRDFPNIAPDNIIVTLVDPTVVQTSLSGRETRARQQRPYYQITCEFTALTDSERRQIDGHIAKTKGSLESFYFDLPTPLKDASGAASGTISLLSDVPAGSTSVQISTTTLNTQIFNAGDYINFSDVQGLYKIDDDITTNGSGIATATFYPPLLNAATTATTTVNYDDIRLLVRYSQDYNIEVQTDLFGNIELTFIEVFS